MSCVDCTRKVTGEPNDLWCTHCEYNIEYAVEDPTGSTMFVALDNEVQNLLQVTASDLYPLGDEKSLAAVVTGFKKIIGKSMDFHITLTKFNMQKLNIPSFTFTKIPICGHALASTIKIEPYSGDE
ncbi:hypothetical protein MKW92_020343 [Papaver armeniacum]|nr:hypothetical protein MKW92_020343 [Papaver armeniacum]